MKRWESDINSSMVKMVFSGVFKVQSSMGGIEYTVSFGDKRSLPNCECLDWRHNKLLSKHFCACMKAFPEWRWEKLSPNYTENPLFLLDATIIPTLDCSPTDHKSHELLTTPIPNNNVQLQLNICDTDNDDFTALPPKRTSGKNALSVKCRNLMKELSGLTFLIDDKERLSTLANNLEALLEKARSAAPNEAGIIIQQPNQSRNHNIKRKNVNNAGKKKNIKVTNKILWPPKIPTFWSCWEAC
jgi:hypothetical protein